MKNAKASKSVIKSSCICGVGYRRNCEALNQQHRCDRGHCRLSNQRTGRTGRAVGSRRRKHRVPRNATHPPHWCVSPHTWLLQLPNSLPCTHVSCGSPGSVEASRALLGWAASCLPHGPPAPREQAARSMVTTAPRAGSPLLLEIFRLRTQGKVATGQSCQDLGSDDNLMPFLMGGVSYIEGRERRRGRRRCGGTRELTQ